MPVAIGFAWVMVIATGLSIIRYLKVNQPIIRAFIGGVTALLMDIVLDPVAYKIKKYWIWEEGGRYYDIPWTNFFGWFLIAFCIHFFLSFVKETKAINLFDKKMLLVYIGIVIMFAWLAILGSLKLAALIGLITAISVGLLYVKRRA